jgi:CSLREA domain-containing protein
MQPPVRRGSPLSPHASITFLITLVAVLVGLMLRSLAEAARPAFVVNDTNDRVDANLGDGVCRTSQNTCTLRAAIPQANMLNGADTIDLPGGLTGTAATVASGSGYREWDVLGQVLGMYATANNGFLIRDAAENGNGIDQVFHSREKGSDNPPRLVISFG